MTGADFTGVDIDLLADYVGGALQGTPDQARVAALIVDDPAWQSAHALLSDGMAEVGDALHAWGAEPEPMPAELAARLESSFGELGGRPVGASGPGGPGVRNNVVDLRAARARRTVRVGASFAAAAAAVALAGVGISYLGSDSSSSSDSSASSAGVAKAEGLASVPASKIISSDTDYSAASLRAGAAAPLAPQPADQASAASGSPRTTLKSVPPTDGVLSTDGLAGGLTRLRPLPALQDCLDAIAAENAVGPIDVQSVDYARFGGKPALVVRFAAANGAWAWVTGPRCGLAGVGADTTYSVKVG